MEETLAFYGGAVKALGGFRFKCVFSTAANQADIALKSYTTELCILGAL